jgi:hypothetical protein
MKMTTPDDFTQEERENLFLIEHLRKLYDTQTQDEQALHAIGARLASSPWPTAPESVPGPGRSKAQQAPGRASFPLSFRPKAGALTLLAATLVVVLLTGSFAALVMVLQHRSQAHGTSAHGSGTPAATTPCTQAYPVSGTITSVEFGNGSVGNATSVGAALVKGPKEQYRGALGGDFEIFFLKETKVFEQQEKGCYSVSLTSLKVGQRIQVQFDGDIMQSLPPQIIALQLLIVADRGSGS